MGPICGRQDPGGTHIGPMNFAIWGVSNTDIISFMWIKSFMLSLWNILLNNNIICIITNSFLPWWLHKIARPVIAYSHFVFCWSLIPIFIWPLFVVCFLLMSRFLWPNKVFHSNNSHYIDVIMGAIASKITSLTIVYSTVYSSAD